MAAQKSSRDDGGNKLVLIGLIRLMRPKHWVKNGFVLAPLMFAGLFTDVSAIFSAMLAFAFFCIASSASYILNDIHDVEADRVHPGKRLERPLAAGIVSKTQAKTLLVIVYFILAIEAVIQPPVFIVLVVYIFLNLAYTFKIKYVPVLDIFSIAMGFVLRVYAGAVALNVPVSPWMFVTTLCLALYLGSIKRRQEIEEVRTESRDVLKQYSARLVDRYAEMSATGTLVFYSLFVLESQPQLAITIPIVLFGLFRYWFVVETKAGGESPTDALLSDWHLMLTIAIWIFVCAWLLWP